MPSKFFRHLVGTIAYALYLEGETGAGNVEELIRGLPSKRKAGKLASKERLLTNIFMLAKYHLYQWLMSRWKY